MTRRVLEEYQNGIGRTNDLMAGERQLLAGVSGQIGMTIVVKQKGNRTGPIKNI